MLKIYKKSFRRKNFRLKFVQKIVKNIQIKIKPEIRETLVSKICANNSKLQFKIQKALLFIIFQLSEGFSSCIKSLKTSSTPKFVSSQISYLGANLFLFCLLSSCITMSSKDSEVFSWLPERRSSKW